jgi:hypothetical protein
VNWRGWLAFAGIGSAVTLACRSDWVAAGGAAAAVLVPVVFWVRGEFAATRTMLRSLAEMSEVAEKPGVH